MSDSNKHRREWSVFSDEKRLSYLNKKPGGTKKTAQTTVYTRFEEFSPKGFKIGLAELDISLGEARGRKREVLNFSNLFLCFCWTWALLAPPIWVLGSFLLVCTILTLLFGKFNNPRKTNEKRVTYLVAQLTTPWVDMTLKLREIRRVAQGFIRGRSISKYSLILQIPIYLGIGWVLLNGNEAALATPTAIISALTLKVYGDWLAVRFYLRDWHRWSWVPGVKKS